MNLTQSSNLIAVYALLRSSQPGYNKFRLARRLRLISVCELAGLLFDADGFPAMVPGDGFFRAEVFRILDPALLPELDRYEGFDPLRPAESLYVRRLIDLPDSPQKAWTYIYNRPVRGLRRIVSGDWLGRRLGK